MRTAIAILFLVSVVVVYYWLQREHESLSLALAQSQEAIIASMNTSENAIQATSDVSDCDETSDIATLLPIDTPPMPYGEYIFALDSNSVLQRSLHPLAALFEKTTPPSQHYEINNKKDVVIKSKLGTVVTIPPNCFVNSNGKAIDSKIDIELKEVFSTSDLLLANLSTTTDDGLWITEGAFYLDATANGKKLKINPSKWIYVQTNNAKSKPRSGFSFSNSPYNNFAEQIATIIPTWLNDLYRAFNYLTPPLTAGFSGKEVFEQLKSYDTMLRRMELRTPQAPPINFEDTIQKHITPKYRSSGKNTYVITQTGWTNINRYLPINKPKKSLIVEVTGSDQENLTSSAFLVFKNHKTILPGKITNNGKFIFNGVPINEKAYVVGLGYKNNQPYIDIIDIDTDKSEKPSLSLRSTTFDMLKYQISQLN